MYLFVEVHPEYRCLVSNLRRAYNSNDGERITTEKDENRVYKGVRTCEGIADTW